jgi:biopolymer transport protein ExbB
VQQSIFQELLSYVDAGGWVMPPLIVLMVVLWFAIGYRFAVLQRGTTRGARRLLAKTEKKLGKGKKLNENGVLVRAARKGIRIRNSGVIELRGFLDDAFFEEEKDIRRYDVLIRTIVNVSPLLGLLGTVIGMIETFDSLGDMSLYSQSGGIAGGISQALFTTQMGLAVSIPGLIVNGILNRKQKDIELELAQIKDILCAEHAAELKALQAGAEAGLEGDAAD